MSGYSFFGLILSIIPGFAHLIDGRLGKIRWILLAWFFAIVGGVFFYGSGVGLLLLGLAVGLHSWIGYDFVLAKEDFDTLGNSHILIGLIVILGLFYWGVRGTVFRDFAFDYTALSIPRQNIQSGDLLLGRQSLASKDLRRGSFVGATQSNLRRGDNRQISFQSRLQRMVVQIVGLPGEEVRIVKDVFIVNGRALDGNEFPVPKWLRGQKIDPIIVADGAYFVNTEYNIERRGGNLGLSTGMVEGACVIPSSQIQTRAIMLWKPVSRRGFLKEGQ